jgi:hypothetical protein
MGFTHRPRSTSGWAHRRPRFPTPPIPADEVLRIAHADAARVYRDLTGYRIRLALEADGWHVDYELKEPHLKGGGPHYLIDPTSGSILSRRYEQ